MEILEQQLQDAKDAMLEMWFIVKHTGDIEDIRELLYYTEQYDTLLKEYNKQIEEAVLE